MSKQLKPVKVYGSKDMQIGCLVKTARSSVPFLCLPLTPASRKRMIEAMGAAMSEGIYKSGGDGGNLIHADVALAALEKMAGEKL